ncbi:MAG: hypothetical protein ABSH01_27185 [Terriglobia bacterium]
MPRQQHYHGLNHLHYLTASTYRRARIFDSDQFRLEFTETLDDLRAELGLQNQESEVRSQNEELPPSV